MRTILFEIPLWLPGRGWFHLPIHAYGTFLVLGLFAGLQLAKRLFSEAEPRLDSARLMDLAVVALLGGVAGARLLYVVRFSREFAGAPLDILKIWQGGLVFHGGLIGGALSTIWFLKKHQLPILRTGDGLIPPLMLGLSWGRLGCFMNGCCFGKLCESVPWAIRFPPGSPVFLHHEQILPGLVSPGTAYSLPVHPTQIYSSILAALLAGFLTWLYYHRTFDGQVLAVAAIFYGIQRGLIEILRDDVQHGPAGLTFAQVVSVLLVIAGIVMYRRFLGTRQEKRE